MGESIFTAKLHSTGTEKVHAITLGGHQSTTACPPPMLKDHPGSTSPHHLFLASIGACVNLVFEIAMKSAHIDPIDIQSEIIGHYETDDATAMSRFTTIEIATTVTVEKGVKEDRLEKLFEVAHANCPIGNCLIGSCIKLVTDLKVVYK
ncbi:MAG: OsmC family protein [Candidatus Thorarchaeota archaeon]|nr:OsmC family protein [Candidatus Thorarchaeota archaeon]